MTAPPHFIVLEGIDGSGTTSQSRALAALLSGRGHAVLETREPSGGVIGRMIRDKLAESADPLDRAALALLFAADRVDHLAREIEPALARGEIVVCDRYVVSSWAYQSLDAPLPWVREINAGARWPDLTFFLDASPEVAGDRVRRRRAQGTSPAEFFEAPPLQRRVCTSYRELFADRALAGVVRVDADAPLERVTHALVHECARVGL